MPSFVLFVLIAQCALSSAFKTAVEYSKQESGYCREDEGWLYLADFEECAAAAAALGQKCNDCDERNAESRDDRPKGCRAHIGDYCCFHWNTHPSPTPVHDPNAPEHTKGWAAVCKKKTKDEL
mmetsp:Transcript_24790/g.42333  ORF Transcript_24790/g.42333 Transcript_24790/m.42333 type:complete len:123 (+) Transcript_24790:21-389(+)